MTKIRQKQTKKFYNTDPRLL